MRTTLCSSADFFEDLRDIKKILENHGYEVLLPSMKDFHHLDEGALTSIQGGLILDHFGKIAESDAIYVANFDKKGVVGYIGGNVFLEMGFAFYRQIPIFLMQGIPQQVSYHEELVALCPIVVGRDWSRLDDILERTYEASHAPASSR